jgi:hypothetical protein
MNRGFEIPNPLEALFESAFAGTAIRLDPIAEGLEP